MAEKDSCFIGLPVELKTKIFHKLDAESKKSARLVCYCWHEIIDNGWRPVTFVPELSDANLKYVLNSRKHFDHLKVQDLTKGLPISLHRNRLTSSVQKLTLTCGISSQNIIKLLRYSSNTKELVLSNLEDETIGVTLLLNSCWSSNMLTSLELKFDTVDPSQSLLLETLAVQSFPYLAKFFCMWTPKDNLQRNIFIEDFAAAYFFKSYMSIHELIVNCKATVKSVSTNFYSVFQIEGPAFSITDNKLIEKHSKMLSSLKNIPLKELEIHAFHQEGEYPWNFSTALIKSEETHLADIFLYNCELITANEVQILIKRNEKALKHFDLVSNYNEHLVVFDCTWLSGCRHLTSLGIDCYGNDTHIFKVINLEKVPKSIRTLTIVSEWLPSFQDKIWITENLLQLYYICINIDRVFTSDLTIEGHAVENEDEPHQREIIDNNHLGNENTNDLFPLQLLKKFLAIPSLHYLTLIHSKSFSSQEIVAFCRAHQFLDFKEKIGTVVNRIYITIK